MKPFDEYAALESREKSQSHGVDGDKAEPETIAAEEVSIFTVWEQERALTMQLMEQVCDRTNLNEAYKRVKKNGGGPGIDQMTIEKLGPYIQNHKLEIIEHLMNGTYEPQAVRGVNIPKSNGGMRKLGIPTLIDRLIQQAILQVLQPIFDPKFSDSSYGFRPKRSAHQALHQAAKYVEGGKLIVVDIDLEKFFDQVNHDILMSRLYRRIGDKRLLKLIRKYLQAGMMENGVVMERTEGTPQGGPLSPFLANFLLDELDQELEKRGHEFCRYADDCNIYVATQIAGERVMESVTKFIEKRLRLKVNRKKSAVGYVGDRKFLGHRLLPGGKLGIAPKSIKAVKDKIRKLTKRNQGASLEMVITNLNKSLLGWVTYYRYAAIKSLLRELDSWIERKIRCYRLKQRKRATSIRDYLISLGISKERSYLISKSNNGWWHLARTPAVHEAMNKKWMQELGLVNLSQRYAKLQTLVETAGCGPACPVV